ncbi:ATP-binding cassette domain-containing protein [Mycoplasma sp. NEAQ87857]|uniref:ATP-binding cassette domain-containing protein n=1 Tax=Mycoplasma sp. NEAQ87857 TaxID=2683967 RepID=UPI0013192333|nr:ATP-binding cassette domain-containing protein [Mycoplasma sp. NEAQ87857]QGZ97629.1 ATP-binding cassette domain-containing protein [Mycoplasma sp. NEAQ87857]
MKKTNAIEFLSISKSFGSIKANQEVSFSVKKGSIHALIGENGAGKSTLMSILFGLYEPDKGSIKVDEKEVLIKGPNDANRLGIGMVHQHFKLVNVYTNLENIVLGDESYNKVTRIIDYKPAIQKIKAIQEKFDLHFDLNAITGSETVATQQKVEIMKMLYRDSDILIFDEPTAVLTDEEIQGLLQTFKLFREQGKTILFISHKLGEIKEVADNGTILRHGRVIENFAIADVSIEQMANMMVGGEVKLARNSYTDASANDIILSLKNVSTEGKKPLHNVSFDIHAGEILAIAGVEGNGQTDLEYVISGIKKPVTGKIMQKRTKLVEEKFKTLHKAKVKKNYYLTAISLLVLTIGILLLALNQKQADINIINKIVGGILVGGFVVLVGSIFNGIYGNKIQNITTNGKDNLKHKLSKENNFIFKSIYYINLLFAGISIVLILISLLYLNNQLYNWFVFAGVLGFVWIFVLNAFGLWKFISLSKKMYSKKMSFGFVFTAFVWLFFFVEGIIGLLTNLNLESNQNNQLTIILTIISVISILGLLVAESVAKKMVYAMNYVDVSQNNDLDYIDLNEFGVYDISKLGLSYIPSDRHKHGLALDYTIKQNTVIRKLWDKTYSFLSIFKSKAINQETQEIIEKYDVRGARQGWSMARSLSGGNQQKFIVGREMNSEHDFILIVQPTRGLDVGAIKNIHERIIQEKQQGKAILLISYELDEVFALADRIAVLNGGEIQIVQTADKLTRTQIGIYMASKKQQGDLNENN